MKLPIIPWFVSFAVCAVAVDLPAQNLLVNGSFESPAVNGGNWGTSTNTWLSFSSVGLNFAQTLRNGSSAGGPVITALSPTDGVQSLLLQQGTVIREDITLSARNYQVSFDLSQALSDPSP